MGRRELLQGAGLVCKKRLELGKWCYLISLILLIIVNNFLACESLNFLWWRRIFIPRFNYFNIVLKLHVYISFNIYEPSHNLITSPSEIAWRRLSHIDLTRLFFFEVRKRSYNHFIFINNMSLSSHNRAEPQAWYNVIINLKIDLERVVSLLFDCILEFLGFFLIFVLFITEIDH